MSPNHSTVDQLRHDIDRGLTGDKVAAPDPAAVPLGTDDEAGGHVAPSSAVAATTARETSLPHQPATRPTLGATWVLVAFSVLVAALFVIWLLVVRSS